MYELEIKTFFKSSFGWVRPVAPLIQSFDNQYLCKESISILNFLHEDKHQGKAASEPTTFNWV